MQDYFLHCHASRHCYRRAIPFIYVLKDQTNGTFLGIYAICYTNSGGNSLGREPRTVCAGQANFLTHQHVAGAAQPSDREDTGQDLTPGVKHSTQPQETHLEMSYVI